MATIVVGFLAAAAAPLTGGQSVVFFVAALAAAYVDATIILPKLFGSEDSPPTFEDLQLQTSTAGAPKTISYGTRTRFGGQVIWLSDIRHKDTNTGGGKAGERITRNYFVDISIGVCEREITLIDLLHVDGELIFDDDPTVFLQGISNAGTPGTPGKLNFWYSPKTYVNAQSETVTFVPLQEYPSVLTNAPGTGRMTSTRAELFVASDPRDPPLGSGVDFAEVRVGRTLQLDGGVWGITQPLRRYTVLGVTRGLAPSVTVKGQSIMRLDIKSATDVNDVFLRNPTGSFSHQSWARGLPLSASVIITNVTAPGNHVTIVVGAGHGITVTFGKWVHMDVIWRPTGPNIVGNPPPLATNHNRGLGGGPFWAISISTTELELYEVDKTTEITIGSPLPALPGRQLDLFLIDDNETDFTYGFNQSVTLGLLPTTRWKPNLVDESEVEFFVGKTVETVKSTIVSALIGEDNIPFRHRNSHFAVSDLKIGHFGNRVPHFSVTVVREGALLDSFGDAIEDIAARCGLSSQQVISEGSVATDELPGYFVQGMTDGQRAIQPLLIAGDIVSVEGGNGLQGHIQFFKRLEAPALGIDMATVGIRASGTRAGEGGILNFREISDLAMPKQIWVRFMDLENKLQRNVAGYMKADDMDVGTSIPRTSDDVQVITLPMSLTPNQAQGIAARLFQLAYLNRRMVTFTLGPKYHWIQENWRLRLTYNDEYLWVRVMRATLGVNMILQVEAVLENVMDV